MNNQLRSVQKEIKSMKKLNHVNIVRLLGYDLKCSVEGKNAIVMVQELAPKGEVTIFHNA
jgi:serine/threonine protein kinase